MAHKAAAPKTGAKVNKFVPLLGAVFVISLTLFAYVRYATRQVSAPTKSDTVVAEKLAVKVDPIVLPKPSLTSKTSLEATLQARRSRRTFTADSLKLTQVSQLLWSAQGVTADWGGRTAPSAKSAYPLTVYLAAFNVEGLNPGVYEYLPGDKEMVHKLQLVVPGNVKETLGNAIGQNAAKEPAAIILFAGDFAKMAEVFDGTRHDENVYLEVGHAAQNVYLQVESLGLGTVTIAGFDAAKVASVLMTPASQKVIYALPIGKPQD